MLPNLPPPHPPQAFAVPIEFGDADPNIPLGEVVGLEDIDQVLDGWGTPQAHTRKRPRKAKEPRGKAAFRPACFGKNAQPSWRHADDEAPAAAAATTPATDEMLRRRPAATATPGAAGSVTFVKTPHDVCQHLAAGGIGELCAQFLSELSVAPLGQARVKRLALPVQEAPLTAEAAAVAAGDVAALAARETAAAQFLAWTAEEQTDRIRSGVYVVEDFPSFATAAGLRRMFTGDEAAVAHMPGTDVGSQGSQAVGVHHHYFFADQLQVWWMREHVLVNPRPDNAFASAAALNGWQLAVPHAVSSLLELSALTTQLNLEDGFITEELPADDPAAAPPLQHATATPAVPPAAPPADTPPLQPAPDRPPQPRIPMTGDSLRLRVMGGANLNQENLARLRAAVEVGFAVDGESFDAMAKWTEDAIKAKWDGVHKYSVAVREMFQVYYLVRIWDLQRRDLLARADSAPPGIVELPWPPGQWPPPGHTFSELVTLSGKLVKPPGKGSWKVRIAALVLGGSLS